MIGPMFSQTLEYAMRIVAHLSAQEEPLTTRQIAQATKVPVSYLSKVLQSLNRSGLVTSQRGLHGGSVLARPAGQITLYDIAQAIDPIPRITTCPLGLKSHGTRLCPLHKRLDQTMELVERSFRDVTIGGLLSEPSDSKPLCDAEPAHVSRTGAKRTRTVRLAVTKVQ
jgi:Rrf2 family nitric oxide-sensitive transcriptional repressor